MAPPSALTPISTAFWRDKKKIFVNVMCYKYWQKKWSVFIESHHSTRRKYTQHMVIYQSYANYAQFIFYLWWRAGRVKNSENVSGDWRQMLAQWRHDQNNNNNNNYCLTNTNNNGSNKIGIKLLFKKSKHLILIKIVCFLVNVWLLQTQSCTLFMLWGAKIHQQPYQAADLEE